MMRAFVLLMALMTGAAAQTLPDYGRYPPLTTKSLDLPPVAGALTRGDVSPMSVRTNAANAVAQTLAAKLGERLSINDFYRLTDGNDYLPAWNRAVAALPASGGTVLIPRRPDASCYPTSGVLTAGDGSVSGPSTKQSIHILGEGAAGTGVQSPTGNNLGTCIKYTGTTPIAAIMQFSGPMTMALDNITLESGYQSVNTTPTAKTTNGLDTIYDISSMNGVVVGAYVAGTGIPGGTFIKSVSGTTAVLTNPATATNTTGVTLQFSTNVAYADRGLSLLHVFKSRVSNVGIKNARVGLRHDAYGSAAGVSTGSADNYFLNITCENFTIAGGALGTTCFDIGGGATGDGHKFDPARNIYDNLVGIYAGDANASGLVLRYGDNLTFRGGMMYSLAPPGLGYALALIPPSGQDSRFVYPGEITFYGTALIGRVYQDPQYDCNKNGGFGINFWNLNSGDMLNPSNLGKGTIPSFSCFKGVDSRGVFFGWSQWRSWLDNAAGTSIAYDAPATVSRKTTLTQIAGTTAATVYATHGLAANAMRSRNSKDYPNSGYPLTDAAQYAYDRVVAVKQSGEWFNNNTATNVTVQIKLGSTVIFDSGLVGLPASGSYGAWRLEGELSQSASNAQNFSGRLTFGLAGSAQTTALTVQEERIGDKVTSVDMTSDQTLTAVITPSTTNFVWNAQRATATVH